MKGLFNFLYQFFFVDQEKERVSHTKFLSIASGLTLIALFVYVVINNLDTSIELWLVFAVTMLGNRSLNRFVSARYGATSDASQHTK